jgi:hypothetical protein
MKILLIFPESPAANDNIAALSQKLAKIYSVRFLERSDFSTVSTDIEVVIVTTKCSDVKSFENPKLMYQADLVLSHIEEQCTYKILKDVRKNVVRDIKEEELFFTVGKYYGLELLESYGKERSEVTAELTDQIENKLQILQVPTDQSTELSQIRELLTAIEGINK